MNTIYDNDTQVGVLTREAFARTGSRLLQIHRFAEADAQHVTRLLDIFDPPKDITVFVPDKIEALMPSMETLNNTVSAALVFER